MTKTKTTKGTKRPKKETPERNALDVDALYEAATNRDGVNPSKALETAADILDLFERLTIQAEKTAGRQFNQNKTRAALLAFLTRVDILKRPNLNLLATINKNACVFGQCRYSFNFVLKWRDKRAPRNIKEINFSINATL